MGGNGITMEVAIAIFALFALLVGLVVYRFEHPTKGDPKITGRGGDFQD